MEQRLSLVTLGVDDLPRARAFYEALGWRGQEVEETVFFQAGGLALVLWSRAKLAADVGIPDAARDAGAPRFGGFALAHNVRTQDEVGALVAVAEAAGARITRPPGPTPYGGWAACFLDPDGHAWEVACNPGLPLDADGALVVPDFG